MYICILQILNLQNMDSIIVQYNLEHLEYNNLEIELIFIM